jgi:hypothetical protein
MGQPGCECSPTAQHETLSTTYSGTLDPDNLPWPNQIQQQTERYEPQRTSITLVREEMHMGTIEFHLVDVQHLRLFSRACQARKEIRQIKVDRSIAHDT